MTMATQRLCIVAKAGNEFMAPYINPVIHRLIDSLDTNAMHNWQYFPYYRLYSFPTFCKQKTI